MPCRYSSVESKESAYTALSFLFSGIDKTKKCPKKKLLFPCCLSSERPGRRVVISPYPESDQFSKIE